MKNSKKYPNYLPKIQYWGNKAKEASQNLANLSILTKLNEPIPLERYQGQLENLKIAQQKLAYFISYHNAINGQTKLITD